MNGKEEGHPDAGALAALAANYVAALEPARGEPDRAAAEILASRIAAALENGVLAEAPASPEAGRLAAARIAAQAKTAGAAAEALREAFRAPGPAILPASQWRNVHEPPAVLWRDGSGYEDDPAGPAHSVLAVGEVAVLSGAGGSGKSFLALALAAASAEKEAGGWTAACGLRVRGGGAVLLSYEDAPPRIAARLKGMGADLEGVYLADSAEPIFPMQVDLSGRREHGRAEFWDACWRRIRARKPSLVILDTGPKACGGLADYSPGPVIAFIQALEAEAREGGFGVLVVAHDTKAARNEARAGGDPGAGAIAGSSQWYDSARGCLYLGSDAVLECIKANYGPKGWAARLDFEFEGSRRGPELAELIDDAAAHRRAQREEEKITGGTGSARPRQRRSERDDILEGT